MKLSTIVGHCLRNKLAATFAELYPCLDGRIWRENEGRRRERDNFPCLDSKLGLKEMEGSFQEKGKIWKENIITVVNCLEGSITIFIVCTEIRLIRFFRIMIFLGDLYTFDLTILISLYKL